MSGEGLRGDNGDVVAGKIPELGQCSGCPKIAELMAELSLAQVAAGGVHPRG